MGYLLSLLFFYLFKVILLLVPVLISVAFLTLLERKILGLVGVRFGPFKPSFVGLLQPFADAFKLSNKQVNLLSNFNPFFYYLSSIILFMGSLTLWECMILNSSLVSFKYSILIIFMVLSLNSINSIIAGWSTFSKFSLVGSLRSVSQLISYESSLYFCVFSIIFCMMTFSLESSSFTYLELPFLYFLPFFFVWVPSFLAELNRTPYDFSEGESELVSGFNTEFGSVSFTLLFLAEYSNILFFTLLSSFLFFTGTIFFSFFFFSFFVIWIRSVLPRYRFDKLMMLAWKFFIPFLTFCFLCLTFSW